MVGAFEVMDTWNDVLGDLANEAYYREPAVIIFNADCLDILPRLPHVDLAITSAPYNLGNIHHTGDKKHFPYPDNMPESDYQRWQALCLSYLYDTINDSLFYNHKNRIKDGVCVSPLKWIFNTTWLFKQEIVWFQGSQNFDKCRFYPMTERIYWLAKNKKSKFINKVNLHDDWHINPIGIKEDFTRAFPIEIPNNIIQCFPNDYLILDPFLGSGTTTIASKNLGRKCIGIEIEKKYCDIAIERLKQEVLL